MKDLGWEAEMEVDRGNGWRAGVLAWPKGDVPNRSIAFEVQLSPQAPDKTAERTSRLEASGTEVVWIVRSPPRWFRMYPSWKLELGDTAHKNDVTDGIWAYSPEVGNVVQPKPATLKQTIERLLTDALRWYPDLRDQLPERAPLRRGPKRCDDPGGWCSNATWSQLMAKKQEEHEQAEAARLARVAKAEEMRSPNLDAVERSKTSPPKTYAKAVTTAIVRSDMRTESDRQRDDRRSTATAAIVEKCRQLGWSCVVRRPIVGSYGGDILAVGGKLIVVEPTGGRQGAWPQAIVIREAGLGGCPDVLALTLEAWLGSPKLSGCDPRAVDEWHARLTSGFGSHRRPRQLTLDH